MPGLSAPSIGGHAALGLSGQEQVSSPSPATSKVDYTQGFGPFWFLPRDPKPIRRSRQTETKFPLLELPLEIRRMIYRCLLDELVIAVPDFTMEPLRLRFMVKEVEDPSDGYDPAHCHERSIPPLFIQEAPDQRTRQPDINNGVNTEILDVLGVYRSIADPSYPQTAGTPTPAQQPELYSEIQSMGAEPESDEAEFSDAEDSDASSWCSDEAEVVSHQRWRHKAQMNNSGPFTSDSDMGRDDEYETGSSQANTCGYAVPTTFRVTTTVDASPKSTRPSHQSIRSKARAAVRILSLTSAQIACELGEVLWANATVHFESPNGFLAFARDRPAALPLIHGIVLELDMDDGDWLLDDTTPSLVVMGRIVSENCRLRLCIHTNRTLALYSYSKGRDWDNNTIDEHKAPFAAAMKGSTKWRALMDQLGWPH